VPEKQLLRRGLDAARAILSARGELSADQKERFRQVAALLGLDGGGEGR